ncbi:MAG TPA: acyl-CoA dehydrogenase family protein [Steroidobacteraceae bacterium]|nr:acyl-CoA dehydrogenase family protein [Steroidobacteraceae bacterium]
MNLEYSAAELQFRDSVRAFLRRSLAPELRARVLGLKRLTRADLIGWHRTLHSVGWSAPSWPREQGGPGWSAVEQHLFDEECSLAGAPAILPFGVRMVGPVIMAFGNRSQQEHFLPRILSGEHWWCQGYSEPGAGSDLASLTTRAVRNGDRYIVNGQKTWNTLGHFADWIFCLVRTDTQARPQAGISFLLIDMKSPGISVRPIKLLDGEHEVNDIFFQDVEVPVANRVGEENKGWTYAKYLLGHERVNIAQIGQSRRELNRLKQLAAREPSGAGRLLDDSRFRHRIAELEIDLLALEFTVMRVLSAQARRSDPGPESSVLKIRGSELQQALAELSMQALGHYALPWVPESLEAGWQGEPAGAADWGALTGRYFNQRKTSIYGGSNEIQRNIIAQRILEL